MLHGSTSVAHVASVEHEEEEQSEDEQRGKDLARSPPGECEGKNQCAFTAASEAGATKCECSYCR